MKSFDSLALNAAAIEAAQTAFAAATGTPLDPETKTVPNLLIAVNPLATEITADLFSNPMVVTINPLQALALDPATLGDHIFGAVHAELG